MVLGEMISVETRAIVGFCNLEAVFVIVRQRAAVAVEVIEDTEFHLHPGRTQSQIKPPSSTFGAARQGGRPAVVPGGRAYFS